MRPVPDEIRPGQESVWTFPRPALLEPVGLHLRVEFDGCLLAETRRGYRAIETSHPPSYYFPPEDVDLSMLVPAARRTLCEWKGGAIYHDIVHRSDDREPRIARNAAWSYPRPSPDFAPATDFLAFYARRVDACFVDGERVVPQSGDFYGGWITSHVAGPFKGPSGTMHW